MFREARFLVGMATPSLTNMSCWFYGLTTLTSIAGWANPSDVASMRHAMNGRSRPATLDPLGRDPSALTDLSCAFAGRGSLTTIYADASWEPPSGAGGMGAFHDCRGIVGGNGTAYSSSAYGYARTAIDKARQAGYLTAGDS